MDLTAEENAFIAAFQARLKAAREERGLTQEQLAVSLGLNKSTYKKYETRPGSSFPLYLLPALCVILARPAEYWIYGDGPTKRLRLVK